MIATQTVVLVMGVRLLVDDNKMPSTPHIFGVKFKCALSTGRSRAPAEVLIVSFTHYLLHVFKHNELACCYRVIGILYAKSANFAAFRVSETSYRYVLLVYLSLQENAFLLNMCP